MKRFFWFSIVSGWLLVFLLSGCARAPERDFSDQDLLVGVSVMPENWALLDVYTLDNEEGEKSGADITFYKTDTLYLVRGGQTVYRYSSVRRAAWHYRRLEDVHFSENNPRYTPWTVPEGFVFISSTVDQWRFECADSTFSPTPEFGKVSTICQYWAQYDEFLIYVTLKTRVDEQVMISMDDVYRYLEAVDQRMTQYLAP